MLSILYYKVNLTEYELSLIFHRGIIMGRRCNYNNRNYYRNNCGNFNNCGFGNCGFNNCGFGNCGFGNSWLIWPLLFLFF